MDAVPRATVTDQTLEGVDKLENALSEVDESGEQVMGGGILHEQRDPPTLDVPEAPANTMCKLSGTNSLAILQDITGITSPRMLLVPNFITVGNCHDMFTGLRREESTKDVKLHTGPDHVDVYKKPSEMGGKETNIAINDCTYKVENGGEDEEKVLESKTFVEQQRVYAMFAVSFFAAMLLPLIPKREDVSELSYVTLTGSCFLGLVLSFSKLFFAYSLPTSGRTTTKIERYVAVFLFIVLTSILTATPWLLLLFSHKINFIFGLAVLLVTLVLACCFASEIRTHQGDTISSLESDLLNSAYSSCTLSVGGATFAFLCFSIMATSNFKDQGLEIELSFWLFFCSNMLGLAAILNILVPLMLKSTLTKGKLNITKFFSVSSSLLVLSAVIIFASKFVRPKTYLLITLVPSILYLIIKFIEGYSKEEGCDPRREEVPSSGDDIWKVWNIFATFNVGLLMLILETHVVSNQAFGKSFDIFVIASVMAFSCLVIQMLQQLFKRSDAENDFVGKLFNCFMCLLQVVAICSMVVFYIEGQEFANTFHSRKMLGFLP